MSCSSTPISAFLTRYAGTNSGWHFSAIQALAHSLTREASGRYSEARNAAENGSNLLAATRQRIATDPTLSEKRRDKLLRSADNALDFLEQGGDISPRWWYALTRLPAVAQESASTRDQLLEQAAAERGVSYADIRREWNKALRDTPPRGRGRKAPSGMDAGLPQDPATRHALDTLKLSPQQHPNSTNSWRQLPNNSHILALHADPHNHSIQVIYRHEENEAHSFTVSQDDLHAITQEPNPSAFIAAKIRTGTWEAHQRQPVTHCPHCGKFQTPQHPCHCPPKQPSTAPTDQALRLYETPQGNLSTTAVTALKDELTAYNSTVTPIYMPIVDHHGSPLGEVHGDITLSRPKWGAPPQITGNPYCTVCESHQCHHITDAFTRFHSALSATPPSRPTTLPSLPPPPSPTHLNHIADDTPVDYPTTMQASRRRKNKTGNIITPQFESVGGPGSHRHFGIEIEVDAPPGLNSEQQKEWTATVARAFHAAGLTDQAQPWDYNESKGDYSTQLKGGWRTVLDTSCSLEIVTPILSDTPETWKTIHEAVSILRDHKATTSTRTGLHVHVSTPDYQQDGMQANTLITFVRHNEDLLVRLAADPQRGTHRGGLYCGPNAIFSQGQHRIGAVPLAQPGRDVMVNLDHLTGHTDSRVEWRLWDGALDTGIIQARTSISLAATELATRDWTPSTPGALLGENHLARTPAISDSTVRGVSALADSLFLRASDKVRLAQLAGVTSWQVPNEWQSS